MVTIVMMMMLLCLFAVLPSVEIRFLGNAFDKEMIFIGVVTDRARIQFRKISGIRATIK